MLVEKSCLQIPLLGLRTYSEQRPGETSAKALPAILFLVSLNAHTTIFDILHKRNCPGWLASDGPEGEDQFFRLLHERFEDIPALLFGGREHGSDDHEVIGAVLGTESTGDFLP